MIDLTIHNKIRNKAKDIARIRSKVHEGDGWERPLVKNFHYIGAIGEVYVGYLYNWKVDDKPRAYGDGGIDFIVDCKGRPLNIDVKTSSLVDGLRVEQYKAKAAVFFFCYYNKEVDWVELVGWCLKREVVDVPPRDTGRGIINHFVPSYKLHKINKIDLKQVRPVLIMPDV